MTLRRQNHKLKRGTASEGKLRHGHVRLQDCGESGIKGVDPFTIAADIVDPRLKRERIGAAKILDVKNVERNSSPQKSSVPRALA